MKRLTMTNDVALKQQRFKFRRKGYSDNCESTTQKRITKADLNTQKKGVHLGKSSRKIEQTMNDAAKNIKFNW